MTKFLDYDGLKRVVSGLKSLIAEQGRRVWDLKVDEAIGIYGPTEINSTEMSIGDEVRVCGLSGVEEGARFVVVYSDGALARIVGGNEPGMLVYLTLDEDHYIYKSENRQSIVHPIVLKTSPDSLNGMESHELEDIIYPEHVYIGDVFDIQVGDDERCKAIVSYRNDNDKPVAIAKMYGKLIEVCMTRPQTVTLTEVGYREPKIYACRFGADRTAEDLSLQFSDIDGNAQIGDPVEISIESESSEIVRTVAAKIEDISYIRGSLNEMTMSGVNTELDDGERDTFRLLFDGSGVVKWSSTRRVWNMRLTGPDTYEGEVYSFFGLIQTGDIIKQEQYEGVAIRAAESICYLTVDTGRPCLRRLSINGDYEERYI